MREGSAPMAAGVMGSAPPSAWVEAWTIGVSECQPHELPLYIALTRRVCPGGTVAVVAPVLLREEMFWLLVVAAVSVVLPTFLKVSSVGQNAALGRVPVKLPLVVSQIRIRSIGEHVNVVVFRLIAIGTWPLISSIPVGLVTLTPASLKRPVSRTLPRAAFMAAVLVP